MKQHTAIGLMSGSSLDGVDLASVLFEYDENKYRFQILNATTIPYSDEWKHLLSNAFHKTPDALAKLDANYGHYLGALVAEFASQNGIRPDFVASHGHTVFHQPDKHFTLQIGNGQELGDACGFQVINDFRSEDVSKGGQGAPLVPIGDKLLFNDYEICLNIGGIANVSYDEDGQRIAYDICIANQALNHLSLKLGLNYDKDGIIARSGSIIPSLLEELDADDYYRQNHPKSMGREFFEDRQRRLLEGFAVNDLLATFTEHIAVQIGKATEHLPAGRMLVTGGGALNNFLIERIVQNTKHRIVVPCREIVEFKEALIFAFLGLLRLEGQTNVLASVTGAKSDSCSGNIWEPRKTADNSR